MAWHLEAVGSQGQRGTGDPKTMDLASLLYKKVGDTWKRGGVLEVRVPAPRQGRLADHLQDQIQHGRPPLLPGALGGVRPGVRRGGRRRTRRARTRPTPPTPRCSATRTSTWRSTRRARTRRARGNLPGRRPQNRRGLRRQVPSEGDDRRAEVDGAVVQPVRLLHPARQERRGRAEAARRGQVRALPPLLRGAALGGGGGLLQGDRLRPPGQRLGGLRRAALPREHQRPHVPRVAQPQRRASTT